VTGHRGLGAIGADWSGGGGRLYAAGNGLAALDDGKLSWSRVYDTPAFVTSFEDGSLAVAHGSTLEIIERDGKLIQTFDLEAPLLTQPAIAGDGSVWMASNDTLFAVR
jgi:hypothetical protein